MQSPRRFLIYWRRRFNNSRYSIRAVLAHIRANVSNWSWGNIVSNLLTLGALLFSIHQNSVSDERYIQNEKDNNKELSRIHVRDSLQSYRDSVQTSTFIEEYKYQIFTNNANRKKDSSQLSLFSRQIELLNKSLVAQNKGLNFQNEELQIQRLSNKSYLTVSISVKMDTVLEGVGVVSPIYFLSNNGKTVAQNIVIKHNLITIERWGGRQVICSNAIDTKYGNLTIPDGKAVGLKTIMPFSFLVVEDKEREEFKKKIIMNLNDKLFEDRRDISRSMSYERQNSLSNKIYDKYKAKLDSVEAKYPRNSTKHYLISQVSYQDRFQQKEDRIYLVNEISITKEIAFSNTVIKPYVSIYPVRLKDLVQLKECITKNKFNYNDILNTLKRQVTETENMMLF